MNLSGSYELSNIARNCKSLIVFFFVSKHRGSELWPRAAMRIEITNDHKSRVGVYFIMSLSRARRFSNANIYIPLHPALL